MCSWLRKLHHCDQEEYILLHEGQETLMGEIMKLQATIGRGGRDEEIEYYVGTICGSIRMEKHISMQSASLYL